PLDNVSVVERWEGQAARWAARTGGSVLELHAYAVDPSADRTAVQDQALAQSRPLLRAFAAGSNHP
ncbi:hypothetical protein PUR61_36785, partial [Streptomyces sp. BE20]|nr:hypothetical protein [Streptomyces sp. BE20]